MKQCLHIPMDEILKNLDHFYLHVLTFRNYFYNWGKELNNVKIQKFQIQKLERRLIVTLVTRIIKIKDNRYIIIVIAYILQHQTVKLT